MTKLFQTEFTLEQIKEGMMKPVYKISIEHLTDYLRNDEPHAIKVSDELNGVSACTIFNHYKYNPNYYRYLIAMRFDEGGDLISQITIYAIEKAFVCDGVLILYTLNGVIVQIVL